MLIFKVMFNSFKFCPLFCNGIFSDICLQKRMYFFRVDIKTFVKNVINFEVFS